MLRVRGKGKLTTDAYRRVVRSFLAWAEGRRPTAELFAEYIEAQRGAGASASRVNQALYGGKAAILQAAERQGMAAREFAVLTFTAPFSSAL